MNRSKQIAAIAESEDEKMCLIRVCDRMERAQEREMPAASAFLSPREQALVQQLLPKIQFWGGTEGAERKIAYYLPEYMEKEDYFHSIGKAYLHLAKEEPHLFELYFLCRQT